MADDRRHGPAEEGNGGPVTPGTEPPRAGPNGNGNDGGSGVLAPSGRTRGPGAGAKTGGDVTAPEPLKPAVRAIKRTRVSGLWVGVTLSAVVLLFLLIFILQNNVPTPVRFLGIEGILPVGVALLFAAVLGVLLVAIPGYLRILQLRRAARKHRDH
ncbi:MAG: hypothetical protein QOF99_3003 [Pseudonocardiales bacterium]|jgi:uncharacterized integral membrane protein|nr:hypothetical protein [Pseudonocardiales bacterium]